MDNEEWRPINGFDFYEISSAGRVRSWQLYRGSRGPRILKDAGSDLGYRVVCLFQDGKPSMKKIHDLLMNAFVGPRPEGKDIRHLDGNPANNDLSNLRYGSRSENMLDAVAHGRHKDAKKTHCIRGHAFTAENIIRLSGNRRQCRECHNANNRKQRARRASLRAAS